MSRRWGLLTTPVKANYPKRRVRNPVRALLKVGGHPTWEHMRTPMKRLILTAFALSFTGCARCYVLAIAPGLRVGLLGIDVSGRRTLVLKLWHAMDKHGGA